MGRASPFGQWCRQDWNIGRYKSKKDSDGPVINDTCGEEKKYIQRAQSIAIAKTKLWILRLALIMPKMMMFREIFKTKRLAVL